MAIGAGATSITVEKNYYGPGGPIVVNTNSAGSPITNPDTEPITGSINFTDPASFHFYVDEDIVDGLGIY
jgi:hypothetical protein